MVVRISSKALSSFILRIQYGLIGIGVLALGYCAVTLLDAQVFQTYQHWRFHRITASQWGLETPPCRVAALSPAILEANRKQAESAAVFFNHSPLGRLEISRAGVDVMILEGTDGRTLRRAVGHIPGTALPGQPGNVAIAGHRDTFFRGLRKIQRNDEIEVTTLNGLYRYRVDFARVIEPSDIGVLGDSSDSMLTLVTCYPFQFVGAAPKRFVVRAHQVAGASTP